MDLRLVQSRRLNQSAPSVKSVVQRSRATGSGLLQGEEIVNPDGAPDPEKADLIMNHMREHGVLIGTTGPDYSVLKFRPPIVFQKEHVDLLLAALIEALDEN